MKKVARPHSIVRSITILAAGSVAAQGLAAVSQVFFVLWLGPVDFGHWATASASIAVLTCLVNFGEVNGYLATPHATVQSARRAIWKINLYLVAAGLLVSFSYLLGGNGEIALLIAAAALNLPLLGESNLLYAAYLKRRYEGRIVAAQVLSSSSRVVVGVSIAALTGSAVAFAMSMLCSSIVMIAMLLPGVQRWPETKGAQPARFPWRIRRSWAAQALSQMLPTQVDYIVTSFVASPALLGVYYLSYQLTSGLSGLVAVPLFKSTLSTLSAADEIARRLLARKLMLFVSGAAGIIACAAAALVQILGSALPVSWVDAAPTVLILLAALPARFMIPLADSVLMANGRWWQSTKWNLVDTAGTAIAALAAFTGDVTWLAVSVASWKAGFALVRVVHCLSGASRKAAIATALVVSQCFASLILGAVLGPPLSWYLIAAAASLCGISLLHGAPRSRMNESHQRV